MAIRESLVIGTDGLERDLKKVEGAVVASAERQGKAVKAAAKRSTKEVVQEYEKAAKEGGRVGKTWADQVLDELRATLRTRQAHIKEAFSRGAFDRATMRQMNQEARREFNEGILKALDEMKAKGEANRDEYLKLARALQAVGPAGRKSIEEVEKPTARLRRMIRDLVTSTKAWVAGFVGIQSIRLASRLVNNLTTEVSKLDAALTNSLAIMDNVTTFMRDEMDRTARRLSMRLNRDANLVAEGYRFLAAAGLDAEKSLASIGTVSTFAAAGQFNLARATDLLTDAQSALGLAVDDTSENLENMTRIADVLTKANTIANATVEQFSEALTNRAAPALRMVNKDVEEGVAVLAAMADQGVKGAEAGTRLDIVLRDLQTRALNNREAFERYNVQVFDANGQMRNMADIIADLERLLDGMSDAQKRATITAMGFQDRSVASLLTLIGTSEQIREYERDLRSAAGATQQVADKQLQSLEARWGRIGQAWAEAKRWAGEMIVLPVAEWIMGIAEAALDFEDPFDRAIDKLQRFGAAAEAIMVTELTMRIEKLRDEARRLEEEIDQSRIFTGVRGAGVTGYGAVVETLGIGAMSDLERLRLRNDLERQLEEQRQRMTSAIAERDQAEERAARNRILEIANWLAALDELAAKQEELRLINDQLRASEEALAEARPKLELRRQIQAIDREIAELNAREAESAGTLQVLMQLEAQKQELEARLRGETAGGVEGGGFGISEEELRAGEAALKSLLSSMREFQLAQALGVDSLRDAFPQVRTALRELLAINEQVETAEQQIADIRAAGMEVPPGAVRYLEYLRELQAELRQVAEREIERWQRDLPEAVTAMQQSIGSLISIMVPMEGGARTLDAAMQGVVDRTRAVKTAEQELQRAQLARDPTRIARAEKELAAAREDLAEFTARLAVALEAAGLPAEELQQRIERLQEFLERAGVETEKTEVRFASLGKQAQTIAGLARGVLSVADAMGVLDDGTRRALEAVVNLGDGIARLVATGGTDIGAWAQSLGSIVQLGSALFGGDPEAKKRTEESARAMRRLTDALYELQRTILSVSTRQLERDREQASRGAAALERAPGIHRAGIDRRNALRDAAVSLGLISAEERHADPGAATEAMRRWASDLDSRYGSNLAAFVEAGDPAGLRDALRKILPEIEAQLGQLGSFGNDPAGIIARVNFELDILGETDAAERLRAVVQALKDAGHEAGEFQAALDELASLDLDTPEGRARRDQLVREMTEALVRGGADLGELTAEQIQDLIRGWAEASPGPGVSRSVQIGASITEVQANEVIAWLEEIAHLIREIRDGRGMGGMALGGPAPALAIEIAEGLSDLISLLAERARTITPEVVEAVMENHFDFRGAQFGRFDERDLDEWLQEVRAEILQRNRRGF